jgi:S1-C subfamily serine protease
MSEGFFHPSQLAIPGVPRDHLCAAMVRILPKTILVLDLASSADDARARARNEALSDGSECWYRFFTPDDLKRVDDPEFAMGMVRHEFARAAKSGAAFPVTVPLNGGGSGFAISDKGHVLTNYHLVTAEVSNFQREAGLIGKETLCRSLRAQIARPNADGTWSWHDADAVWLVSNPPTTRAFWQDANGLSHPREDTALLRVEPAPLSHVQLSDQIAKPQEPVWMAGFPLRSARTQSSLQSLGYTDADGSLRVSSGQVTELDGLDFFTTDLDGSMGNSGSPVFDQSGAVIGLFCRATGDGPRNAFEYGHMHRVHVTARLAVHGLKLDELLPGDHLT